MNHKSLDRILKAVGGKFVPANLDRLALWADLGTTATLRNTQAQLKTMRRERQRLAKIIKAAKKLKGLLKARKDGQLLPKPNPMPILDKFINACETKIRPRDYAPLEMRGSDFELAISVLQMTYKEHFRRDVKHSRGSGDGAPSGPFLRFAEACLKELRIHNNGKAYKRESIISAVKRHPVDKLT